MSETIGGSSSLSEMVFLPGNVVIHFQGLPFRTMRRTLVEGTSANLTIALESLAAPKATTEVSSTPAASPAQEEKSDTCASGVSIERRQEEGHMKQTAIHLEMNTRTISIEGVLKGSRHVAPSGLTQWYEDLLDGLRTLGFLVTQDGSAGDDDGRLRDAFDAGAKWVARIDDYPAREKDSLDRGFADFIESRAIERRQEEEK